MIDVLVISGCVVVMAVALIGMAMCSVLALLEAAAPYLIVGGIGLAVASLMTKG